MSPSDAVLLTATGLIGLLGILGNVKVLWKLSSSRARLKRTLHISIQAAAVSFVLFLITIVPYRIAIDALDSVEFIPCQIYAFADSALFTFSSHVTVIAAFERQQRFSRPFKKQLAKKTFLMLFVISMLTSIVVSAPFLIDNTDFDGELCLAYPYASSEVWHGLCLLVVQLVLPLPFDVFFNVSAWRSIHRQNLEWPYHQEQRGSCSLRSSLSISGSEAGLSTGSCSEYLSSGTLDASLKAYSLRHMQTRHTKLFFSTASLVSSMSMLANAVMLTMALFPGTTHIVTIADVMFLIKCSNAVCNPLLYIGFGWKLTGLERFKQQVENDSVFISKSIGLPNETTRESPIQPKKPIEPRPRAATVGNEELGHYNPQDEHHLSAPGPLWHKIAKVSGLSFIEGSGNTVRKTASSDDKGSLKPKVLETLQVDSLPKRKRPTSLNLSWVAERGLDTPPPKPNRKLRNFQGELTDPTVKRSHSDSSVMKSKLANIGQLRTKLMSSKKQHCRSYLDDRPSNTTSTHQIILPVIVVTSEA